MNTFKLPQDFTPTLDHLLQVANTAAVDRLSFVRCETPDQTKAVLVLMLSQRAIRELGTYLIATAKQCRPKQIQDVPCDGATPAPKLIAAIEESGSEWGWGTLKFDEWKTGLMFILIGRHFNEEFCAVLSDRGCITKLQ